MYQIKIIGKYDLEIAYNEEQKCDGNANLNNLLQDFI